MDLCEELRRALRPSGPVEAGWFFEAADTVIVRAHLAGVVVDGDDVLAVVEESLRSAGTTDAEARVLATLLAGHVVRGVELLRVYDGARVDRGEDVESDRFLEDGAS